MELHERLTTSRPLAAHGPSDPFSDLKNTVHLAVIGDLGPQLFNVHMDPAALRERVTADIRRHLSQETGLSRDDRDRITSELADDILGHGPLERLLADDSVTEIMVNGPFDVWIERQGRLYPTTVRFNDDSHLRRIINKIVAQVGRRVDESSPMVDARLPDGSRVNAIIPPLSLSGPLITIRKFSRNRLGLQDMIKLGTLTTETVEFIERCVQAELNILVSGGTGTGKTTLLNAVSEAIPESDRIVTIEDSAEALDMLQAMNTGHEGSLSTVHSNSPRDALSRIETMVLMAGFDLPLRAIRQQVASALDMIIHLERVEDGSRKVTSITEVQRMESEVITMQELFTFKVSRVTDERVVVGTLETTGLRPTFLYKFEKRGIALPSSLFQGYRVDAVPAAGAAR
jgi:pilus assembly protein CpaF